MYCKNCGKPNQDWSNYCIHDGTVLALGTHEAVNSVTVTKRSFCPDCGNGASEKDNYCRECGQSLFAIKENECEVLPVNKISLPKVAFSIPSLLKKVLIPAIIAFIIMLALNVLSFRSIHSFYEEVFFSIFQVSPEHMAEEMGAMFDTTVEPPGPLIGLTDHIMLSHGVSPTYHMELTNHVSSYTESGGGELSLKGTFVILLLLPFIALFAAGIVYRRKNEEVSLQNFLTGAMGIGLLYSLLLLILSFFSGFNYKLDLSEAGERIIFEIGTAYSFLHAFLKAFFLGTMVSFFGMLFSIDYRRVTRHLEKIGPYGNAVHQGFAAFVRGFFFFTLIMILILYNKMTDLKVMLLRYGAVDLDHFFDKTFQMVGYLGVQLSSIIYSLLPFSSLSLSNRIDSPYVNENGEILYSIFNGFRMDGDASTGWLADLHYFFNMFHFNVYLKLALVIPILFLLCAGFSMAKYNGFSIQKLAVASLVYSLLMAGLAIICGFEVEAVLDNFEGVRETILIAITVNSLKVWLGSFILAFAAGFAGSFISRYIPGSLREGKG